MSSQTAYIGDLCDFVYGKSLREDRRKPGTVPVFGSNGIIGWHSEPLTRGPTIVVGRKGSIGEVNWSGGPCFPIDTTYFIDETKAGCDLRWLYFALLQLDLTRFNKAAAIPGLNRDDAYKQHVRLPSLTKQKQIAKILDRADRLRRTRRYALELSEDLLAAVFSEMFASALFSPSVALLGNHVVITGGGTPSRDRPEYFTGYIPWLTSKDMKGDYIWDTEEHITEKAIAESATKLVPAGSVLLVVKSKVLMHRLPIAIARVPLCHGQDIKSMQVLDGLHPEFLRYLLKHYERRLLGLARGANTEGLTLPMLAELPVPNVPLEKQLEFARLAQRYEKFRRMEEESLRQAEHLFQALMHESFGDGA